MSDLDISKQLLRVADRRLERVLKTQADKVTERLYDN